ncbi:PIN domain-containing protein [Jiella marina]|uniref:PIN domain-containing protein n=1 Tax=Jiella sp. LLJ827 TaxID=2917712 RepID=UPI002101B65A|nr:PIN domain-containing protein [Jiella sp. LLJ827]
MSAAFFDTNIIVYAADTASPDPVKRDAARRLMQIRQIVTSTQVMLELYSVLRRKLAYGADAAMQWVRTLQDDDVVALAPSDVIEALQTAHRHDISHWDGLIIVAAARAGLDLVYSEDLNHGQTYGDVRVCNPFIEDFLA